MVHLPISGLVYVVQPPVIFYAVVFNQLLPEGRQASWSICDMHIILVYPWRQLVFVSGCSATFILIEFRDDLVHSSIFSFFYSSTKPHRSYMRYFYLTSKPTSIISGCSSEFILIEFSSDLVHTSICAFLHETIYPLEH